MRVQHLGWGYFAAFIVAVPPFCSWRVVRHRVYFASPYLFPSRHARRGLVFSSLSLTVTYGLARFAQPRSWSPDALKVVAEYLSFLQAPTRRTCLVVLSESLRMAAEGNWRGWALRTMDCGRACLVYGVLVLLAGRFTSSVTAAQGRLAAPRARIQAPCGTTAAGIEQRPFALEGEADVLSRRQHWSRYS